MKAITFSILIIFTILTASLLSYKLGVDVGQYSCEMVNDDALVEGPCVL